MYLPVKDHRRQLAEDYALEKLQTSVVDTNHPSKHETLCDRTTA